MVHYTVKKNKRPYPENVQVDMSKLHCIKGYFQYKRSKLPCNVRIFIYHCLAITMTR